MIAKSLIAASALILVFLAGMKLGIEIDQQPSAQVSPTTDNKGEKADYEHGDVVSFSTLIAQKTGQAVIAFSPKDPVHQAFLELIRPAADAALVKLSAADSPIKELPRINEASRFFEDELMAAINATKEFSCEIPQNAQGDTQRSGYPDLMITHLATGTIAYLDPKLVAQGSERSSFRSFYYQPRTETSKIHHSALHFVIGILHDGKDGDWTFTQWKLVDLSTLKLKLKSEFSSTNRDMYEPEKVILSSEN